MADGRAEVSWAEGASVAGGERLGAGQERDGRLTGNWERNDRGSIGNRGKYR